MTFPRAILWLLVCAAAAILADWLIPAHHPALVIGGVMQMGGGR